MAAPPAQPAAQGSLSVDVIMLDGRMIAVPYLDFHTIKDLLDQLLATEAPENRRRYAINEFRRSGADIDIERPLDGGMNIDLIKAEWAKDRFYTSCLKLIRLQHAVVVNYNIMFRMSTGIAEPNTTFYVSEITTVSQLLNDVKAHLKIPRNENKYGLMGYIPGEPEMRRLSNDDKVYSLKTAWDHTNQFFQFQLLPEAEDQLKLGADREGYVEQTSGMITRRRWASLRGTSLFLFREKGDQEVVMEIDNVHKRPITLQGSGKKKGLGIGQKFNFRFDIEYEGKTECFFVEDEASMSSWVEPGDGGTPVLKSAGARREQRNAQAIADSSRQRTLVQLGSDAALQAAGHKLKEKPPPDMPNEKKVVMLLDEVKKRGEELINKRDANATKEMIAAIQNLVLKVGAMIDPTFSDFKKQQINKYSTEVKAKMKELVADAKTVSQQLISGKIAPNVITPELRKLKATVGTLFTACEHLAMSVNLDDADLRALLEPREPQRHNTVKISVKATGNEALDSAMSGLNMIGVDPELAEMMKQAAKMEGGTETSAAKARAYAYYAGGGDVELDSMLANLSTSLTALDGGMPVVAPQQPAIPRGGPWTAKDLPPLGFGALETCATCLQVIDSGNSITLNGKQYHQRCYICSLCGARFLPTERVYEGPRGLMCEVDFMASLPPCVTCLRGVPEHDQVKVGGKVFHRACFKCQTCHKPAVGDVYEDRGVVQCEACFFKGQDLICVECSKPIKTEFVLFENKKRHVQCFNCSYCRRPISQTNAKIARNKLYCLDCCAKLYG